MWAEGPIGSRLIRRAVDAASIYFFVALTVALLRFVLDEPQASARVGIDFDIYRAAVPHFGSDDVYQQPYWSLPFAYPPTALFFLSPTAISSESTARAVWFLLGVAAVWVTMRSTTTETAPASWWSRTPGSLLLTGVGLLTFPIQNSLAIGQVSSLLMGMVAVAALGRRRTVDGCLLGAATSIKLTPGLFALWWWMIGRRSEAIMAGMIALAIFGLGWLTMPSSTLRYFFGGGMLDLDRNSPADRISNQSMFGVATRMGLDSTWERAPWLALTALLTAWALVIARRLALSGELAIAVSLVGVWSGIAAPLAWAHAFVWWAPLAAALGLNGRLANAKIAAGAVWGVALLPILVMQSHFVLLDATLGVLYPATALLITFWLQAQTRSTSAADRPGGLEGSPKGGTHVRN